VATTDVTQLLLRAREGDRAAIDLLLPLVYQELRAIASRRRPRGAADPTLDTTALVHEAYLKLFDRTRLEMVDREHFFAVAAMAMRQIAIDQARRSGALKRGGDRRPVDLDNPWLHVPDRADELLAIDQALDRLAQLDERLARVVELRFFAGLTEAEIAEALGRDERTVRRDWRKARAVLHALLSGSDD
jgi:RNA polymerase sigma factor (TIGR02999 family)